MSDGNKRRNGLMQGMAPPPEQLSRMRQAPRSVEKKDEKSGDELEMKIKNDSPFFRTEISMIMFSIFWQYQKRILDIVEIFCHDDRQWATTRRVLMDIQTEQIDVMRVMVAKAIRESKTVKENSTKENEDESNGIGRDISSIGAGADTQRS
jgi:hypothetical protein